MIQSIEGRRLERQKRQLIGLCHSGADAGLPEAALAALREAVPFALHCWGMVDPETWMPLSHADNAGSKKHLPLVWENEYAVEDVSKIRHLARMPLQVSVLSRATGGEPWRSARHQTLHRLMNMEHELRAGLTVDGTLWGFLTLLREPGTPDFAPAEAAFVSAVAPHLAHALRATQLSAALGIDGRPSAPGLILLDGQGEFQAATREADELLEELAHGWRQGEGLPEVVHVLAVAARAVARGALEPGVMPRGRLRAPSGRWLVLHGSVLSSPSGASQLAVTVEPARTSDVAPLLVKAYDFTDREQEVVLLVLRGLSTAEIARALCIAAYTVQDHLKAIFDKAGVRTRRELVAEVFYRHHAA